MGDLYYATRVDRNGYKLTTSYTSQKSADKYGGAGSSRQVGILYADIKPTKLTVSEEVDGPVFRSLMLNPNPVEGSSGEYVLYGKRDGRWDKTAFSANSYGAANTLMKSLIGMFQAIAIVQENDEQPTERYDSEDTSIAGEF